MTSTAGTAAAAAPAPAAPGQGMPTAADVATPVASAPQPGAPVASPALPMLGAGDVTAALTRWQAALTVAAVIWSLLTVALLANSALTNRAAAADTAQLTRIHAIESSLFRADAIATNAFLVGGLEPAEQRTAYDDALAEVSRLIIDAAEAQPADRAALAELSTQVLRYAEQMQQARANNRQGLPVGAQYLREASTQLRSDTLPVLEALVVANDARATAGLTGHNALLIALPGLVMLGLMGWFNQRLAALFRRRINVGLVVAAAVVLAVTALATSVTWSLASASSELAAGDVTTAVSTASARTEANDAKSNESLRLIARGSGAAFEEAWEAADIRVRELIGDDVELGELWSGYRQAHAEIIAADEAGDWEGAVELAVDQADGSASSVFATFDERAVQSVENASARATTALANGANNALGAAAATLLGTVLAIAALSWGLTARRKEFS